MSAILASFPSSVDAMAAAVEVYILAKRAEDAATKARIEAEQRILALHPGHEEASDSFEAGGYKVTVTGKLTYACDDVRAMAEACAAQQWSPSMIPVKTQTVLDATGCKWLRHNEPEAWAWLSQFVTVKPAKTAVSVKV